MHLAGAQTARTPKTGTGILSERRRSRGVPAPGPGRGRPGFSIFHEPSKRNYDLFIFRMIRIISESFNLPLFDCNIALPRIRLRLFRTNRHAQLTIKTHV